MGHHNSRVHANHLMRADSDGNIAKKARNAARLLDGSELGQITFESTNDRSKVGHSSHSLSWHA